MTDTIPDLWPDEIAVNVQSPAAILRRQASQLRIRTKDSLEGELKTSESPGGAVTYDFRIVAPALDGYTHSLFTASHEKELVYPVEIYFKPWDDAAKTESRKKTIPGSANLGTFFQIAVSAYHANGAREAATPNDLIELLKEILNSGYTKGIIMSLLARVNESKPEETSLPPSPPNGQ